MRFSKDTRVIFSISSNPGNFGTKFHNYFYKACPCVDVESAVDSLRNLALHGMSVSMPFKQRVIPFLDEMDVSAVSANAVNTVVNIDGQLKGYCTDWIAIDEVVRSLDRQIEDVQILGSGAMAEMCNRYFSNNTRVSIAARNLDKKSWLDKSFINSDKLQKIDLLINATPVYRKDLDEKSLDLLNSASCYIEYPVGRDTFSNITEFSGLELTKLQAKYQFSIYTGIPVETHLVDEAFEAITLEHL